MSNIKPTCVNCKHYCSQLTDLSSNFHIHDYCKLWRAQIPDSVIFDREDHEYGYTDIEAGIVSCWAFEAKNKNIIENFPRLGEIDTNRYKEAHKDEYNKM